MIDHVITRRRDKKDFLITRTFHATCFLSDHTLLRSIVLFRLKRIQLKKSAMPRRINVLPLRSSEKRIELSNQIDSSLESVLISETIESSWKSLRDAVHTTSMEVLGLPIRKHQDWFDDNNAEVKGLIKQMHDAHKVYVGDKQSSANQQAYKKCKGKVQTALRQMKNAWWDAKATELQDAADKKTPKHSMMV